MVQIFLKIYILCFNKINHTTSTHDFFFLCTSHVDTPFLSYFHTIYWIFIKTFLWRDKEMPSVFWRPYFSSYEGLLAWIMIIHYAYVLAILAYYLPKMIINIWGWTTNWIKERDKSLTERLRRKSILFQKYIK